MAAWIDRRQTAPKGVSALEFMGCLSAMIGGVVLGSFYLGVDVKGMAFGVLEKANIVEPRHKNGAREGDEPSSAAATADITVQIDDESEGADTHAGTPAPQLPGDSSPSAPPANENNAPPTEELAPPTTAAPLQSAAALFAREDLITADQRKALTLAYWDALARCMKDEVAQRVPAVDDEGNWQLFDYLTGRKEGHAKTAAAIAALDRRGVDDHVLAFSKKALAWHQDGAKLFGRAVDLLTDAPTAQLSGPFAQSWQSAATQHRMEARLLAEKHQAVASYLNHTYPDAVAPVAP